MRFTKPSVASLAIPPNKTELIVFDDALPGFGLRLRAGGKRTWIVQYRIGIKQRRLTLGSAVALDLERARLAAKTALSKIGLAVDPQAEKSRARADAAITLRAVINVFLAARRSRLKPRSYVEVQRHLVAGWSPLHGMALGAVTRSDIAARLTAMISANGPTAADRARAALSALYNWAMREGIVSANPVAATNRPATATARERVLTDAELVEIWHACRDSDYGRIVRLLMLTGQRRDEIASMAWSEIDGGKAVWSIPAERTKNGRPHDVPLSAAAAAVLEAVERRQRRRLLFGSGERGFSGWSRAKLALDHRIAEARDNVADGDAADPIVPWRLHDLRRTMATRMGDLGIEPHIVEAALNHVSGARAGVAGVYNRSLYTGAKRRALDLWGEHIRSLVGGSRVKVVAFRKAAS